ncbi:MAG: hypothetical protein IKH65_02725 [Clostridia bacterium]|nr:hypothetical protein [Clostridia bacterium]
MKGNTLVEFINDLLTMGGPEKEFEYNGKRYFIESQAYEQDSTLVELVIFECFGDENYIFRCHGKNNAECVEQFENAKLFDGRTIYEAEQDITVLFG